MGKRIYKPHDSSLEMMYRRKLFTLITPTSIVEYFNDKNKDKPKKKPIPKSERRKHLEAEKEKQRKAGIVDGVHKKQCVIFNSEFMEDRYRFDTNEEPHSAFNIFINCVEKGYYPPTEVLTYLSSKFNEYLNSDDSLDSVMKVDKWSKNAYKNIKRNINIVVEIDTLKHHFGIKPKDAINAVVKRHEDAGIFLDHKTFEDIYYRDGKKQVDESAKVLLSDVYVKYDHDDSEEIEILNSILNRYPKDVIKSLADKYPNLKKYLSEPIIKL